MFPQTHAGRAPPSRLARTLGPCVVITLLSGPVHAQSAASSIDQPTPGTLPPGVSTTSKGEAAPARQPTGRVAPPSAIQASTDVMQNGSKLQGKDHNGRTDPLKHLPKDMR